MPSQEESETLLNFGQNQGQEPLRISQFQSPFVAKNPKNAKKNENHWINVSLNKQR
jgi:hypothetical protein